MTTDYEDLSITSLPLASDKDFVALVTSFSVDPDSPDLSFCLLYTSDAADE